MEFLGFHQNHKLSRRKDLQKLSWNPRFNLAFLILSVAATHFLYHWWLKVRTACNFVTCKAWIIRQSSALQVPLTFQRLIKSNNFRRSVCIFEYVNIFKWNNGVFVIYCCVTIYLKFSSLKQQTGTSLVAQWIRLCTPNAGGVGSIPGQETRSPVRSATKSSHAAAKELASHDQGAQEPQLRSLPAATKTWCNNNNKNNHHHHQTFII